jgi:hypothetical protein
VDVGRFASASSAALLVVRAVEADHERHVGLICSNASIRPRATSSQRVMPPKMLNSTAVTFSLERITSTALVISSASARRPRRGSSRLAAACATTSSVLITSPAPLPRMPMSPSSLTYVSPRSRAIRSCGSSWETLRQLRVVGRRIERVLVERDLSRRAP